MDERQTDGQENRPARNVWQFQDCAIWKRNVNVTTYKANAEADEEDTSADECFERAGGCATMRNGDEAKQKIGWQLGGGRVAPCTSLLI
jgi:hypothetical protein